MFKKFALLVAAVLAAGLGVASPAAANQTPAFKFESVLSGKTAGEVVYQQATPTQPKITVRVSADLKRDILVQPLSGGTVFNCPNNYICLFDGTNYGTYHWAKSSIPARMGSCTNLTDGAYWPVNSGASMNNTVSSVIVNPDSVYSGGLGNVTFWPNANCAGTPRPYHLLGEGLGLDPDLTNGGFHISANWSNQLTSVAVEPA